MAIDGTRILHVAANGLTYLDDKGEEAFIAFAACYERKLAEFMHPDNLKEFQRINPGFSKEKLDGHIQWRKSWKRVADRNPVGQPLPYIEFYTDPPLRFEFVTIDEFQRVRTLIEKTSGWKTFDKS
jgi:hypothetical protein